MKNFIRDLDCNGFAIVAKVIDDNTVADLIKFSTCLPDDNATRKREGRPFARRNLLQFPEIAALANSHSLRSVIEPALGAIAFPVRGILFDKNPSANWVVPWHQDLSIAVNERGEIPGFGPWSEKAGVVHVQPPKEILEQMLTVRIHLDDCNEMNGPLRVVPGSHREILSADALARIVEQRREVHCTVSSGGAVLMRPMLIHASSPAKLPSHRRVIHIEYAACQLPEGLRWHVETAAELI